MGRAEEAKLSYQTPKKWMDRAERRFSEPSRATKHTLRGSRDRPGDSHDDMIPRQGSIKMCGDRAKCPRANCTSLGYQPLVACMDCILAGPKLVLVHG